VAVKKKSAESGTAEVETYLARVPEPARTTLEKMRAMIRAAAPKNLFKNSRRNRGRNMRGKILRLSWSHVSERFDRRTLG
jgi:hypothetical protein